MPASKMNEAIAEDPATEGYVEAYAPEGEGIERVIRVDAEVRPEARAHDLGSASGSPSPDAGSTSAATSCRGCWAGSASRSCPRRKGVMTDKDASRKGIGGEVLAHVWYQRRTQRR